MPIARNCSTAADMEAWYPPGHGDFYESFYNAGLLEDFIKQVLAVNYSFFKKKIMFASAFVRLLFSHTFFRAGSIALFRI